MRTFLFLANFFIRICFSLNIHASEYLLIDDMGRKTRIEKGVEKIISLSPATTEILFDLELENRIKGVSYFSDFPEEARKITKVGTYVKPLFEKIVSLKPDIIIATAGGLTKELGKKFDDLNLPLYVVFPKEVKDIPKIYKKFGKIFNKEKIANKKAEKLESKINSAIRDSKEFYPYKILYLLQINPIMGVGENNFINDLLLNGNFRNVLSGIKRRYPVITLEKFIKSDPDIIISSDFNKSETEKFLKRYQNLRAIKNKQVYFVSPDIFTRPGPRISLAIDELFSIRGKAENYYKKGKNPSVK